MHVDVYGLSLWVEQRGEGPDVLLIHGLGSCTEDWADQIEALSSAYRVTALDLRGHGRSERVEGLLSTALMARDVVDLLDVLGIARAHLVGLSLGGMVAQQVALYAPARVASLTLVNTSARVRVRGLSQTFKLWQRKFLMPFLSMARIAGIIGGKLFPDPDQVEIRERMVREWGVRNDRLQYLRATRAALRHDVFDRLDQIRAPTLLVRGAMDTTIPSELQVELEQIPKTRLVIIDRSRHATPVDAPERFNQVVLAFLADQEGRSRQAA